MRLDKFLKDSRLVKRRTIAKEMCDAGKVKVNDKLVKASYNVAIGEQVTIEYVKMFLTIEIVSLDISLSKALAANCYKEIKQELKTVESK